MNTLWRCRLNGYTLIFAIVVIIIVTATSLLLLSYFRINTDILNNAERIGLAKDYAYQCIYYLKKDTVYDQPQIIHIDSSFNLTVEKKNWGAFDVYIASVGTTGNDSVLTKISLVGNGADTGCISLYLANTPNTLSIGDSVAIAGKCFLPLGIQRQYNNTTSNTLPPAHVFKSADTLMLPAGMNNVIGWLQKFSYGKGSQTLDDTIVNSFSSPLRAIYADSVVVYGSVHGNVLIAARRIKLAQGADVQDIVLKAERIIIPDGFSGSLQAFASDSIIIGKNVSLGYPSILALLPQISDSVQYGNPYMYIADSLRLCGEIYAYASDQAMARTINTDIRNARFIAGGIYTSGDLKLKGYCQGTVLCDRILGYSMATLAINSLDHLQIDSLPHFFAFSPMFPFHGAKKVIKWLP